MIQPTATDAQGRPGTRSDIDRLVAGLLPAQREAVLAEDGVVCVMAGAGTGKTRVLTLRVVRRALDRSAHPAHVLVCTFSRKAAEELSDRLWALGVGGDVHAGTFHRTALRLIRQHRADRGSRPPVVLTDRRALLATVMGTRDSQEVVSPDLPADDGTRSGPASRRGRRDDRSVRAPAARRGGRTGAITTGANRAGANTTGANRAGANTTGANRAGASRVEAEIGWAKARLVPPDGYEDAARRAGRRAGLATGRVAELYARYEDARRRRGVLDLDDLLWHSADLLEDDPGFARAVRWRHRHLFVDETQDLNVAQFRLLRLLAGAEPDLFVVGDPNQSVYGWNGADPGLLDQLPETFPGARVVRLDANHRCSPQIVRVAAAVLRPDGDDGRRAGASSGRPSSRRPSSRRPSSRRPSSGSDGSDGGAWSGEGDGAGAVSTRTDGPVPRVASRPTDADEAAWVARHVWLAHRPGRRWSDIAVLARTNAQLALVAGALVTERVPHRSAGSDLGPASDVPRTGQGAAAGQGASAGHPNRLDLDADDRADFVDAPDTPSYSHGGDPPTPSPVTQGPPTQGPPTQGPPTPGPVTPDPGADPADAVVLATFHRAKGLQWPSVFVVGLSDGLVPLVTARSREAREEERRLLYVALTRAEDELTCSWAAHPGGRPAAGGTPRRPSPWLAGMEAAITGLSAEAEAAAAAIDDPDRAAGHIARIRSLLEPPDPVPPSAASPSAVPPWPPTPAP